MQFGFSIVCLLIAQLTLAQADNHVKVPGTKCSLVPPTGFVAATSFSGFQHTGTGASIMINEIPAPYQTLVGSFTAEALKAKGMTLVSKNTIDFNNSKATLIYLTQTLSGISFIKQILIFGDTKETILVNGVYPEKSKGIEAQVKEALLSTIYNASQDVNPLDAASFQVDTKGSDFKVVKYLSGSLLYSTDGKIPTDKPKLIVGNSLAKVSTQNRKQYAEERVKSLPRGESTVIDQIGEIAIDNLKGYEIIAKGKSKDDKPELVYQVILFNDLGDYYIILGQAKEDFEKNLDTFKKIAKTFKRK